MEASRQSAHSLAVCGRGVCCSIWIPMGLEAINKMEISSVYQRPEHLSNLTRTGPLFTDLFMTVCCLGLVCDWASGLAKLLTCMGKAWS